jgi:alkanesulfonate monooxygenase SsuD/methylene tetrahydromethanopterin reductase-like flavin-dependent oxidoreductase (luciferase family)
MGDAAPLKIGVQLPEVEREVRWPEYRAMLRLAEEVGFDSVWFGDHLLYRSESGETRGPWEAWSMLAGAAAVTDRVELGPLVAATSFHAPAMLAKKAAAVDEISGGRLILGLGAGWNEVEYRAFGFPFDRRVARFEEAFTIIRTLLAEGRVDFEGMFYRARGCELLPAPIRPGGPPLMVGSVGPRMLRITMPHVAAWNAWYEWFGNTPEGLVEMLREVDRACVEVGRDPGDVERTAAVLVAPLRPGGRLDWDETRSRKAAPIHGDIETIASRLRAFGELGMSHLQLVLDPITPESIERCGEVLTLLR